MPTISYRFDHRCQGGGHTFLGVRVNAGAELLVVYDTDDVTAPINQIPRDKREEFFLHLAKFAFGGKTRAEVAAAFQAGGGTVTITVTV